MQFLVNGAWTKRSHVGHAAMCGLIAATLAREGYKGAADAHRGQVGFPARLRARRRRGKGGGRPRPPLGNAEDRGEALSLVPLQPRRARRDPRARARARASRRRRWRRSRSACRSRAGSSSAIRSPPSSRRSRSWTGSSRWRSARRSRCAAAASCGTTTRATSAMPATLALCKKVRTRVDPQAQADFPAEMSASVQIKTARGAFETYVRMPKGEPANFLSAGGAAREVRRARRRRIFPRAGATSSRARCSRSSRRRTSARCCA